MNTSRLCLKSLSAKGHNQITLTQIFQPLFTKTLPSAKRKKTTIMVQQTLTQMIDVTPEAQKECM